jgi:hypothetical protein
VRIQKHAQINYALGSKTAQDIPIGFVLVHIAYNDLIEEDDAKENLGWDEVIHPGLDFAKKSGLKAARLHLDQSQLVPPLHIWKIDKDTWAEFYELSKKPEALENIIPIQDEWFYEQNSHHFLNIKTVIESAKRSELNILNNQIHPHAYRPVMTDNTNLGKFTKLISSLCTDPLTHKKIDKPVITPNGTTYEETSITSYLEEHIYDPETQEAIIPQMLIEDISLTLIMYQLPNLFSGKRSLLLCPKDKIPLTDPYLVNSNTPLGKEILKLKDPKTEMPIFLHGTSYNKIAFEYFVRSYPFKAPRTRRDFIKNKTLKIVLREIESVLMELQYEKDRKKS